MQHPYLVKPLDRCSADNTPHSWYSMQGHRYPSIEADRTLAIVKDTDVSPRSVSYRSDTRRSSTNLASQSKGQEAAPSSNRIAMRLRETVMWISTYGPYCYPRPFLGAYANPTYESFRRSSKTISMCKRVPDVLEHSVVLEPQWLLRRRKQSRPAPPRVIACNIIEATKSNRRRRRIKREDIGERICSNKSPPPSTRTAPPSGCRSSRA